MTNTWKEGRAQIWEPAADNGANMPDTDSGDSVTNRLTNMIVAIVLAALTIDSAVRVASANVVPHTAAAARAAASDNTPGVTAFKKAIREKYELKEKSFAAHDAETIVTQFYTADAISVGEREGIFIGRDQLRSLYQEVVKDNAVKIDSVYTYVNGSAGWDWADFNVTPTDTKVRPFTFAILFLWTKVGSQWMCKGDFFVNGSFRSGRLTPPPTK